MLVVSKLFLLRCAQPCIISAVCDILSVQSQCMHVYSSSMQCSKKQFYVTLHACPVPTHPVSKCLEATVIQILPSTSTDYEIFSIS